MAEDRWEKVGELFEEALELPPDERAAFLEEACEEEAVRKEVLSLLEAVEGAGGFFEDLAQAVPSGLGEEEPEEAELRTSDPLDLEGTQVGRYAIEEHLGGGGMGVVYRARDPELDRLVALKFLPPYLATSEEAERRFVREARAASALEHPHIATIYEIGEDEEGRRFIAMAYYEGETLKEKIDREGKLPIEKALQYAEQIAEALARAHEAEIVHRDVKPANVMVTGEGEVKLLDFGLAKAAAETRLTEPGRQMGTAAYMSPEQAEGKEVDGRTDLWALGALLYEMLAGERPFEGGRSSAVIHAILHEEPTPVGERRDEVSAALEQVVHRCLRKDPGERYPSAEALLEELQSLRTGSAEAAGEQLAGKVQEGSAGGPLSWLWRFVGELRQRRVLRVAAVYAGTGFIILQLGEILVEPFGLPGWTLRLITLLLALGFPLAVGLAWVFDVTEEGLVRTGRRAPAVEEPATGGKPFTSNGLIVALLLLAIGLFLYPRVFSSGEETAKQASSASTVPAQVEERSIAVLPFEAQGQEEPGPFTEGIHDDLLTRLSKISALKIISRTSVERYRDTDLSLPAIADSLGVRWIMEGSVLEAGGQIRVNAQLIDPRTDTHVWAEDYRRALTAENLFAIQGDITQSLRQEGPPALRHLKRAVELKPSYGEAYTWLGWMHLLLGTPKKALKPARRSAELNPLAPAYRAYFAEAYLANGREQDALKEARRARELQPEYGLAHFMEGLVLHHLGRYAEARSALSRSRSFTQPGGTPTPPEVEAVLAATQVAAGDSAAARKRLAGINSEKAPFSAGLVHAALGNVDEAFAAFRRVQVWDSFSTEHFRYFFPDVLGPLRRNPRYDEVIREINRYWGLDPDGSIPEEADRTDSPVRGRRS